MTVDVGSAKIHSLYFLIAFVYQYWSQIHYFKTTLCSKTAGYIKVSSYFEQKVEYYQ